MRRVGGKTILQHTYDAACRCSLVDGVIVAVDHQRLADEVDSFGGNWMMTSSNCNSGTDRIAEVAAALPEVDVFVNVQGDEPEIEPEVVDLVAKTLVDSEADLATVGTPIRDLAVLNDPSNVKIVMSIDPHSTNGAGRGRAIYFSRSAVPYSRGEIDAAMLASEPPIFWHHIGLYAYRREFLRWFSSQPPSLLETTEQLEQLRAIEAGKRVVVARIEEATPGIDTQADLDAFSQRLACR